jgi:hypothetical protein
MGPDGGLEIAMRGKQVSPGPLPQRGVWNSLGSNNPDGRSESGLSSDAWSLSLPLAGRWRVAENTCDRCTWR